MSIGAHPRSRGENLTPAGRLVIDGGSSPLTRGKLIPRACISGVPGLIPAHAGKTGTGLTARPVVWAHPRSRGENANGIQAVNTPVGSSPLTRGKLFY